MDANLVSEVIACLPEGKTHFRYFKNGYALRLLSMAVGRSTPVREVRKTAFGKLLDNVVVKEMLSHAGNGLVDPALLRMTWREPSQPYLLSASRWNFESRRWSQVSRAGDNLVLQLNLTSKHQRLYQKYVGNDYWFNPSWGHPIQRNRGQQSFRETLAWARIDLSFQTDEALIEEVQSDAAREMHDLSRRVARCKCDQCRRHKRYLQWFELHKNQWSEAMLTATIEFIRYELGIKQIFIHTDRSGWKVKKMEKDWGPPKSLYSSLPRKFAFTKVWNAPSFLLETRSYQKLIRQQPDIDFYMLDFSNTVGGCHA